MKLRPLPSVTLIAVSLILCGCLSKNPSTNPTTNGSSSGETNATSNTASSGDDVAIVRNAFAQLSIRPFVLREDSNMGASDQIVTRVVEFVPPDRRHVTLGNLETISIGSQRYNKLNGVWTKTYSPPRPDTNEIMREAFHHAVADGSLKIQHSGTDALNEQAEDVYTMTGTVQFKETTIKGYTMKVWVTKGDGLVRKVESTNEANKQWKSVVTYEYPPSIKIEAPIQ